MENKEKQQGENSQAIRWAENAGIMRQVDPRCAVTYGELADILHQTLEYFFARLIAAVEDS